ASPIASPPSFHPITAEPVVPPPTVNPAVAPLRDSAVAARGRADRTGAGKVNVPAWTIAETMLQSADQAAVAGDQTRATNGYSGAIEQYRKAGHQATTMHAETKRLIEQFRPVV